MKHVWSLLAQHVITSQETQNLSLIDIVDRIGFLPAPGHERPKGISSISIQLYLVSLWIRSKPEEAEEGRGRIIVKDPRGRQIIKKEIMEFKIDLTKTQYFRMTGIFKSLPFTVNGMYRVVVQLQVGNKWKEVAFVPLQLVEEAPPPSDTHSVSSD